MQKKHFRKKQLRTFNKDESSITEEMKSNANNPIFFKMIKVKVKNQLHQKINQNNLLLHYQIEVKMKKLNTFSYMGKKDKMDKRLSVKQNKEEAQNTDYFNEQFQFFSKTIR